MTLEELEQRVIALENKRVTQKDIINNAVKQRHVEAMIVFRGLAADRPDGSTEVKAYFSTDTNVLSIWNGSAWVTETMS